MIGAIIFYVGLLLGCLYFRMSDAKPAVRRSEPVVNEMPRKKSVIKPVKRGVQIGPVRKTGDLPGWFCVRGLALSPAEKLIAEQLSRYNVKWFREVAFVDFPSSKYGHYRYDFLLPDLRLIVEYDGKLWHEHPDRKKVDDLKDRFCTKHGIAIKRYSSKDYYKISERIALLMKQHGVSLA